MPKLLYSLLILFWVLNTGSEPEKYRSPLDLKYSPDGKTIAVTDFTKGMVYLIDAFSKSLLKEIPGYDRPFGLLWVDQQKIAVSEYGSHQVSITDIRTGQKVKTIKCCRYPMGIAQAGNKILVGGFGRNVVGIIDMELSKQLMEIPVVYQPDFITVLPDNPSRAFVSNLTPGSSQFGAKVSVLDISKKVKLTDIELPFGSSNVRQIIASPDGKWVYVAHTYGKVMLPTTQIEKGWISNNVVTIIDAAGLNVYATLPLDFTMRGASDPWGLDISNDGSLLYVSLAGVNEIAVLNLEKLHSYLAGKSRPANLRQSDANAKIAYNIWEKIYKDPSQRKILTEQLAALYAAGLIERYPVLVNGPRGIALSADDNTLAIAGYFAGEILWFSNEKNAVISRLKLGKEEPYDIVRQGEVKFHSALSTQQNWLSCVSCHPAGRADGLNWDLLNDGIGNPKNAKSLLLAHETPPSMSMGVRSNYEVAVEKGFNFIQFHVADNDTKDAVKAFLRSMKADKSPYLGENGELTAKAKKGKILFESDKVGCAKCHSGPNFTDLKMYNVGTRGVNEKHETFDNPALVEVWRTAPYLHDGSASSIMEVLTTKNPQDKHGKTSHLKKGELEALEEYVNSL